MKKLSVSIPESEYEKFGFKSGNMTFDELMEIIGRVLAQKRLVKSTELAEKYGLSDMTLDEINEEISKTRKDVEGHY